MAEEATRRPRRKRIWISALIGVVLIAAVVSLTWYLRSAHFEDFVRRKLIATLEDATGGRVEMASFNWNLSQLAFEARDLTIHGLEPPDQLPYAHVDRLLVRLHVISFFSRQFNLEQVDLRRPVIHLIVYPDGKTNAPEPKVKIQRNKTPVQELFDLAINRADLRDGVLLLNERKLPLDFTVNDLVAAMTYDPSAERYDGSVQVGKMDAQVAGYRDVSAWADLQFSLWQSMAEIKSLRLTSEKSSAQISGKLSDFQSPKIQLTYASTINVSQLGAIARKKQLRGGTLELNGSGSYAEAAGYFSTGRIAVRDLDYVDDGIALRRANLNSNFSLANNRLQLTQIAARFFGGQVTGDADIRNLLAGSVEATSRSEIVTATRNKGSGRAQPQALRASSNSAAPQEGSARLRVSGLSLNELVRMMSSRSMPLDKLNAAGSVGGSVNLSWKQTMADAIADLALDVAPPPQPSANQLPVGGSMRGRYSLRSGRTDLSALDLTTPRSHVEASGALSALTADLKLDANTTSLAEFQPLIAAMNTTPLALELDGNASFTGTVDGKWRAPQIAGHLQATNFTYLYASNPKTPSPLPVPTPAKHRSLFNFTSSPTLPSPPPEPQTRRIHIDSLNADVQYSQSGVALHHAVVQEGSAQFNIDGSTALDRGDFTPNSQFQVEASVHNADVAELQRSLSLDYPVSGSLNFTLHAAGTANDPHGAGDISLTNGKAYERPIHVLSSKITFANHAAQLENIHLEAEHGRVVV